MKIRVKLKDTGVIKELNLKEYQLNAIRKFRNINKQINK